MTNLFPLHITNHERLEAEQRAVDRRVLPPFWKSAFLAMLLCAAYVAGRLNQIASGNAAVMASGAEITSRTLNDGWSLVSLPDPPSPLLESASPYLSEIFAANDDLIRSPLKLDVLATQDSWLDVETDGHKTFAKLVRASQTFSFGAVERIRVMTGNSPGVELRFNGEPALATDAKSRVRTLEFTAEGLRDLNSGQRLTKQSGAFIRPVIEKFEGYGSFSRDDLRQVELAFEKQFGRSLPVSAKGQTTLHRALGYDHSGRVDVPIFPDTAEGLWLRNYLAFSEIPYAAFRRSVQGNATAAHIHIGPPSHRSVVN